MCNIEEVTISESDKVELDHQQITTHLMDSPTANPDSAPSSNDETTRVKFLCSFSGSILPRPQDGKLRYVGGETRIVSVPRDITYEELMSKMRELFEGANVLKYQQPDEDLDALVSVVNDDDVTNMMEEYDKLGSGDGFTRLRIFLFVHPDQDGSLHFVNGDERDNERRYVDALNSLNESPNFRKQQSESLGGSFEDVHAAEQYFSQMSLEGSIHGQRNMELPMAQMNLRQLTIPRLGSGQLQQPVAQRYNDMEAPWSPAYYSPRQPSSVEPRPVPEFPISPSSSRYRLAYGDFSDRVPEDYNRTPINIHPIHEQHLQYQDNVVVVSPSPAVTEKAGFPGNILQGSNVYEGNSICEYCRMAYHRNQVYPEHPHVDPPSMASAGYIPGSNSCVESPANREIYVMNRDANLHPPFHCRDHYHDSHGHERGWVSPHQSSPWAEELRPPVSAGYIVENGVGIPVTHGNVGGDSHPLQPHYVHHEDHHYVRPGVDYGAQMMLDQATIGGSQIHLPAMEERVVRYLNPPYMYGNDSVCQVPHVHMPSHTLWRNVHNPVPVVPSYEASTSSQVANGSTPKGFIRESSPRLKTGLDYQNPWIDPSQRVVGLDGSHVPDYSHSQVLKLAPNTYMMENQQPSAVELPNIPLVVSTNLRNYNDPCPESEVVPLIGNALGANISASVANIQYDTGVAKSAAMNENVFDEMKETNMEEAKDSTICGAIDQKSDTIAPSGSISSCVRQPELDVSGLNVEVTSACAPKEAPDDQLDFLPELIESVKEAALQSLKEVKAKVQVETDLNCDNDVGMKEDAQNHKDGVEGNVDVVDLEHDNDNANHPEIELTKAEAEAIDRGLQTIKYEDLEEIRELGSGTYGSVYHGKWKGSDVAIKKIKASCFAARPSERERLIADFWKEALLLSSLHHPNVVSFYGVVRDGPDGSLATVTEYMVNGSLKQYLQKKNSTIDRRKRIIIAMDVAIGMEYLHEKKIVHFDLKCENLLVNMRDPHRPVCKIADMGLSKVRHKTLVSGGVRGTLPWMAPELLNGKCNMVSEKIDVYSFAIVMWELLTGDEPYANMHGASIIGGIVNNTLRPQTPERCDPEWKSLMESCWAADPTQRPSFSEISQKLRNMAAPMNPK